MLVVHWADVTENKKRAQTIMGGFTSVLDHVIRIKQLLVCPGATTRFCGFKFHSRNELWDSILPTLLNDGPVVPIRKEII